MEETQQELKGKQQELEEMQENLREAEQELVEADSVAQQLTNNLTEKEKCVETLQEVIFLISWCVL